MNGNAIWISFLENHLFAQNWYVQILDLEETEIHNGKRWFSQKDIHTVFPFLFLSSPIMLASFKIKICNMFCPAIFSVFEWCEERKKKKSKIKNKNKTWEILNKVADFSRLFKKGDFVLVEPFIRKSLRLLVLHHKIQILIWIPLFFRGRAKVNWLYFYANWLTLFQRQ